MTVNEYLDDAPEPHRTTLIRLRATLRSILPYASETISSGVPAFKVEGKAVAGYSCSKGHCSYFPHSGSVLPQVADELGAYDWSKGTLRFPIDDPLSRPLVERLVQVRLEQLGLPADV